MRRSLLLASSLIWISGAIAQNTTGGGSSAVCSEYQDSVALSSVVNFQYVVILDDPTDTSESPQGILSAQLTYAGIGWVGFGISSSSSGSMVPGEAIIGLPDEALSATNPGKYDMTDRSLSGVTLFPDSSQTLNATIVQDGSSTTLTFQKQLVENGELTINGNGVNVFMWATGFSNALEVHGARGSFTLSLKPCNALNSTTTDDDGFGAIASPNPCQSFWQAHGVFSGIAWGVMAPLAIASSLLRDLFSNGLWFKFHMFFNIFVGIFTLVSFVLAVVAVQKGTVSGDNANHFCKVAHRTVGLIIMIFVSIQIMGGMMRPHAPAAAPTEVHDEEGETEPSKPPKKTKTRKIWEIMHKVSGFALLGAAMWQVQSGLKLYATRFAETDLSPIFWGIIGSIGGITVILYLYVKCCRAKN